MGDNAHQPIPLGELVQHGQGVVQHILVQGSEALVDKEGFQLHAAGVVLHHVGQAKGQGQGGVKGLAAGETGGGPPFSGGEIKNFYVEPRLGVGAVCCGLVLQLIAPAADEIQTTVRHFQNLPEYGAHYIALKAQPAPVPLGACRQRAQLLQSVPGSLCGLQCGQALPGQIPDLGTVFEPLMQTALLLAQSLATAVCRCKGLIEGFRIAAFLSGGLLTQLCYGLGQSFAPMVIVGKGGPFPLQPGLALHAPAGEKGFCDGSGIGKACFRRRAASAR